jgi:hypothetical protein
MVNLPAGRQVVNEENGGCGEGNAKNAEDPQRTLRYRLCVLRFYSAHLMHYKNESNSVFDF